MNISLFNWLGSTLDSPENINSSFCSEKCTCLFDSGSWCITLSGTVSGTVFGTAFGTVFGTAFGTAFGTVIGCSIKSSLIKSFVCCFNILFNWCNSFCFCVFTLRLSELFLSELYTSLDVLLFLYNKYI